MNLLHTCRCCNGGGVNLIHSLTGVPDIVRCDICKGSGLVCCLHCDDTGWMPVADSAGYYAGDEPCICQAGRHLTRITTTPDELYQEPF